MTQRRDLPQSGLIWVGATPAEQRVDPGDQAVFAIVVENRSTDAQQQTIAIGGIPIEWARIDFDTRGRAFPQERRSGTVTISVPAEAEPGVRDVAIVAHAGGEESAAAAKLDILATAPLPLAPGLTLRPVAVDVDAGGEERRIQIDIRNVGALDAEYALSVSGLQAGWQRLTEHLRIAAGGAGEAELWLRAPAAAPGGAHRFVVRVAAAETPEVFTEASGELRVSAAEQPSGPPAASPPRAEPRPMTPSTPAPPPVPIAPPPPDVRPLAEEEFETAVRPPDVLLAPGTSFRFGAQEVLQQAIVTIQNRSRIQERYVIEVSGLPESWYALTANDISLDAGDTQQVPMRLSPHPGPEHPAGEYHFPHPRRAPRLPRRRHRHRRRPQRRGRRGLRGAHRPAAGDRPHRSLPAHAAQHRHPADPARHQRQRSRGARQVPHRLRPRDRGRPRGHDPRHGRRAAQSLCRLA